MKRRRSRRAYRKRHFVSERHSSKWWRELKTRVYVDAERTSGAITRFSDDPATTGKKKAYKLRKTRKYTSAFIREAVALAAKIGITEAAIKLGLLQRGEHHAKSVLHTWYYRRRLPKTGRYSLPEMLKIISRARDIWRAANAAGGNHLSRVWHALFRAAVIEGGLNVRSLRVYLCMEAIPALPGFQLYQDPATQQRCEELAAGLRVSGNPTFERLVPEKIVKAPAVATLDDRAKFLAARKKWGLKPLATAGLASPPVR